MLLTTSWFISYDNYRIDAKGWQNSIRHNLSLSKAFYRTKGQAARKGGGIWRIDPKHSIGAFKKLTLKNSSTKPKTVRFNESFWEPDNDMYNDPTPTKQPIIIHEEPATKMVKLIASPAIKQPKPLGNLFFKWNILVIFFQFFLYIFDRSLFYIFQTKQKERPDDKVLKNLLKWVS